MSRRKEAAKTGADTNEIETEKVIENTSASKSWVCFFETINEIDKLLSKLSKKRGREL